MRLFENHFNAWLGLTTLAAGLALSSAADAQGLNRAAINRPSLNSPSVLLGRTGGAFTTQNTNVLDTRTGRAGLGAGSQIGGSRFGTEFDRVGGFARNRFATGYLPDVALPTPTGAVLRPSGVGGRQIMNTYRVSSSDLAFVSGLYSTTDLSTPLGGNPLPELPNLKLLPEMTVRTASPYHAFFGVVPASEERPPIDEITERFAQLPSLPDQMETRRAEESRMTQTFALVAFKDATVEKPQDVHGKLIAAERLLTALRDSDRENYIAPILLAHVALERDHITHALANLSLASRRHPNVFVERPDLGSYFGDREVLDRQVRRYIRLGTTNPNSPETLVIEGYCAWLSQDYTRSKNSLDRAEKISIEQSWSRATERSGVTDLIWALRAAVESAR